MDKFFNNNGILVINYTTGRGERRRNADTL